MAELPFRELYEVGGSLRDELLGRAPKDVDFLVRGHDVEELLALCRQYGQADELRVAGRLVGVRFWPSWGPREGIEVVPPRRETPIAPGEPGFTGNPHIDFRIEPDAELPVRDDLERRDFTVNAMARDVRTRRVDRPLRRSRRPARRRAARRARDGLPRRPAAHPARRGALQRRRPAARCGARASSWPRPRRASPSCRPSACARSSSARSQATAPRRCPAPGPRCRRARRSALPEWAACIGFDQHSASQAYTLDEHILHVLEAAVHEHAAREPRLAAFWHDVGKPLASGERPARRGRSAHRSRRAAAPDLRQRHRLDGHRTSCASTPINEDREPSAHAARVFLARVGRERARDLLALRRWDRIGRGVPIAPEQVAAARALRATRRAGVGSARGAGRPGGARRRPHGGGLAEGPAVGETLRRLLAAVVDEPSLNERETLLALAVAPESID